MIGSGKYNFPGIRKTGAAAFKAAVATTGWGAAIAKSPFSSTLTILEEWVVEWLTNKGLVILNLGAIYINGEFDQAAFDKAMDAGLKQIEMPGVVLTEAQKKVIDDEVKAAFRRFAAYTK